MPVYLHGSTTESAGRLRRQSMALAESITSAEVCVVPDVADLDLSVAWPCVLAGKMVCDEAYITSSGTSGTSVKYARAVRTTRRVHIAPEFVAAHTPLAVIVVAHCRGNFHESNWHFEEDPAKFLTQ
eukprot:14187988-Alexandrium_andersonii.AAC.1